ncbi:MAG TPA: NADH-quinone oxidoreductase subunit NuoK [Chryseosolibacter sp.]|nr:NADH-quinone oxidoreductase subunit NuoK [Chryseosolibacter sp.]
MEVQLLYLGALLFCVGLAIIIIKRSAIMMLIGIELLLNAANLNLVALNKLHPQAIDGQMFALFVIIVAVSETAVGLAIVMFVYRHHQTSVPDQLNELKD